MMPDYSLKYQAFMQLYLEANVLAGVPKLIGKPGLDILFQICFMLLI